jgi:hypothetical protein
MRHPQNGNILFLILIAVALFAALSYAVTTGSRNSSSGISKDKAKLAASALIQYGTQLENGINRITVSGQYKPWQVNFACNNKTYNNFNFCHGNGAGANCTSDECRLFSGGYATPIVPPIEGFKPDNQITNGYARRQFLHWIDVETIGSETLDIGLVFYGVNDETCKAVNEQAGLNYAIYEDTFSRVDFTNWSGNPPAATGNTIGDNDPELAGKKYFCIKLNLGRDNVFIYVLSEL